MFETVIIYLATLSFALWGIMRGLHKGLSRQSSIVLALSFGIVAARIVVQQSTECAQLILPEIAPQYYAPFVWSVVGTTTVFYAVYGTVAIVTRILDNVLANIGGSLLDKMFGSIFGLFNYLVIASTVLNLFLAWKPESNLKDLASHGDGNLLEEVLLIAPALLGSDDVEELYHAWRMNEAKKIS